MPWSGGPQIDLLAHTLDRFLQGRARLADATKRFRTLVPPAQQAEVEQILNTREKSYPPGLLVQLAYALAATDTLDIRVRQEGARGLNGVSGKLGKYLLAHHIMRVPDAFQNIAKNTSNLVRGNFPAWDNILTWGSGPEGTRERIRAIFDFACATLAARARPVRRLPELSLSALTFGNVMSLFEAMLAVPTEGAHEQFIVAALLHALVQQNGSPQHRVETKSLNASDAGARAAGDVQILLGNQLLEAYEVTVVDVRAFVSTLTAALRRQFRGIALGRLYEHLDRRQPVVERVNDYVQGLEDRRLVIAATAT